ncbi:unnamed protein product [Cuscuta europaea]|uniref:DNA helicase n=1 Tax=Cuscuta europaea TaxID=41803 RepID=A0A9P0ZWM6_CUSEU|nr:unnamed protein product [Cuscuta europaea]
MRLIITRLGNHVLGATILGGKFDGQEVVIPRLTLTPSDARIPFKFQRRQFPIMPTYAMTINKMSRVTNRKGLKILICDENDQQIDHTTNVVYKEVFQIL